MAQKNAVAVSQACCMRRAVCAEIAIRGEPSSVQTVLYRSADCCARRGMMIQRRMGCQMMGLNSTTRRSPQNSSRYCASASRVGAAGEPVLTMSTAVFAPDGECAALPAKVSLFHGKVVSGGQSKVAAKAAAAALPRQGVRRAGRQTSMQPHRATASVVRQFFCIQAGILHTTP